MTKMPKRPTQFWETDYARRNSVPHGFARVSKRADHRL
jgi:hypothetical protein